MTGISIFIAISVLPPVKEYSILCKHKTKMKLNTNVTPTICRNKKEDVGIKIQSFAKCQVNGV